MAFVAWFSIDDPTALTKPADLKARLMSVFETQPVAASPPGRVVKPPVAAPMVTLQPEVEPPDIRQQSPTIDESVRAYEMGRSLMSVGRHREAMAHFERATHLDPASARAQYNLGLASVMSGDLNRAHHATLALRELDPSLANMLANLVRSRSTGNRLNREDSNHSAVHR